MGGMPCIRGLRIPIATIVGMLAEGMTEEEIFKSFPDLEHEDIREKSWPGAPATINPRFWSWRGHIISIPALAMRSKVDLQVYGYPILLGQFLPLDDDLLDWLFGAEVKNGDIRSPLDIHDVWPSSYSGNTNEILWAAKFAARFPWITCVIRLTNYECGMDQPTYTPVKEIVERSGTLFFSFQDLDSTKPAGSVKIRIETIVYYLARNSPAIMQAKRASRPTTCPLD
jgi:Protein of unknown function (DUF433)